MRRSDLVFFLSGAAALVYETVWIRLLARLVGSDSAGMAIVLAIFMGGMGLGAWLAGPLARRTGTPLRLFCLLELSLAAWAALSPFALELVEPASGAGTRALLAAGLLLAPTVAMGATFPLMGRLTIANRATTGRETAAFYGANTLGAACGALLGPLVGMPLLGLTGTVLAAAGLDVAAAALAARWLDEGRAPAPARARAPTQAPPLTEPCLVTTFLLGLAGLGLEVLLARVLVTVTGTSVYAYAIVLSVFLFGIGLGSRQLAGTARGPRAGAATLFHAALALGALTLAGLSLLSWQLGEADLFASLSNRMPAGAGVVRLWLTHALLAALALLGPALALGLALPSAAAALVERHPECGAEEALARVYAVNTAGALCGSLLAGLVLPAWLGPRATLLLLVAVAFAAALAAPGRRPVHLVVGGILTALLALAGARGASEPTAGTELIALHHGTRATVAVEDSREAQGETVRSLRVDGKVVATTAPVDLRLQRLLSHVPALLHGQVRTALVIGLGTGMTAGALLYLPELEELEVFEISPAVLAAAREFTDWNGGVLTDPRVRIEFADGRLALARSKQRFDLITSDPIHPWTRGSSDLYSVEHFRNMADHLAEGGVASQWLPLYQLSTRDVRTVVATWCAAFEHTSAWLTAYDLALVGSHRPLEGEGSTDALEWSVEMGASLAAAGIHDACELAALQVADDPALRAFAGGVAPMTDDRPVLEFRAPLSFLAGYSVDALRWAGRAQFVDHLPAACRPAARATRRALEDFLEALPAGLSEATRRYGEELLAPRKDARAR